MPELPEVESFRRALEKEYRNKTIAEVIFRRNDIRYPLSTQIKEILRPGALLEKIERDGKQLLFATKYGAVQISLGMSGAFLPSIKDKPILHEHVSVVFDDNSVLGYIDPRRFGFWKVYNKKLPHLADPLSQKALVELFANKKIRKQTRTVKDMLMDQKIIGGVGNIYALEALHLAGIRPTRRINTISTAEWKMIALHLPQVLQNAIECGGSTISTYRRLSGEDGNFQELHRVYDREGEHCMSKKCTSTIKRTKQGGRSSWYCPTCQK